MKTLPNQNRKQLASLWFRIKSSIFPLENSLCSNEAARGILMTHGRVRDTFCSQPFSINYQVFGHKLHTHYSLRINGAVPKGTLLWEQGLQGLQQPTHPQAIGELDAVVDGSGRQNEEFVDRVVQLLDTINHFPMLLNNNSNNKAEPDSSSRQYRKHTSCNPGYSGIFHSCQTKVPCWCFHPPAHGLQQQPGCQNLCSLQGKTVLPTAGSSTNKRKYNQKGEGQREQ